MAVMGFNPAMEMSQLRTQQTLAMQSAAPAVAPVTTSGAVQPAAAAADPAAAMAAGAAAPGAAGDAAVGGMSVQPPPPTSKIVLQSVLKGAMTGASVALGFKQFGPLLGKIPFIAGIFGKLPVAGAAGAGLLGFLGKLPIVGSLLGKVAPLLARTGMGGFLVAALLGAGVGAVFGAISGMKKAKAAAAEYAEAQAKAQQAPVGDPLNTPKAEPPVPLPGPGGKRAKSWIISRTGSTSKTGGSFGHYNVKKGDTVEQLAKRFHTTPAELKRLNPGIAKDGLQPGEKIKLKRKVVPNAKAWVA